MLHKYKEFLLFTKYSALNIHIFNIHPFIEQTLLSFVICYVGNIGNIVI